MLVLSRKVQESLVLVLPDGQHITVTVAALDARRVRLGIEAPPAVAVLRSELVDLPGEP